MSVRYRLFLWLSGLFLLIVVFSYFSESYVTKQGLARAEASLRKKLLGLSEEKRKEMESFLADVIAENQVKIDAVLNNVANFSTESVRFSPTVLNKEKGTWEGSIDLLMDYKWVDFLQNTNEGELTAGILPAKLAADGAYRIKIDEELSWVYLEDGDGLKTPYIAVTIPYRRTEPFLSSETGTEEVSGIIPAIFLLYEPEALIASSDELPILQQQQWAPIPVGWAEGYELVIDAFAAAFQRARNLLRSHQITPPDCTPEEMEKRIDGKVTQQRGKLAPMPAVPLLSREGGDKIMMQRIEELGLRDTQISMIWILLSVYESGVFGKELFSFPAPSAITLFALESSVGFGFHSHEVLFSTPLFDDAQYFQKNPTPKPSDAVGASVAVIAPLNFEEVYLGNSARLIVKTPTTEKTGYFTMGVSADTILEKLVLAVQQTALLAHDGKLLSACVVNEGKVPLDHRFDIPLSEMLTQKSGIISWSGENYFYLHIQPFPQIDLHFFLLNPEAKEFALLRDLDAGSQQVVHSILYNIHITGFVALLIALASLHLLSRRITRPIIQLAQATRKVAEGRYDEVHLTLPPLKHNDEIALLCHSFEEMVQGLQEKEKVKGVLNKVVSQEIAEEILKGNIHLGGEEKKVTVLFADIRDFTAMTQNMMPVEVIDLLNGCMTKISHVIDQTGGVIDKFVGDEAMALFGAPIFREDAAMKAIESAIEIIAVLKKWNEERMAKRLAPIEIGIGIHTGKMLAGNMGAENRLNYTVIGSNVNLAARLCNAAKRMEILITKDTLEEPFVKERVIYEPLPEAQFKGFDQRIAIFEVKGIRS